MIAAIVAATANRLMTNIIWTVKQRMHAGIFETG